AVAKVLAVFSPGNQGQSLSAGTWIGRGSFVVLVDHFAARQEEECTENCAEGHGRSGQDRSFIAPLREETSNGRADEKAESERDSDQRERFCTIFGFGDIADVGLGDGEIAGGCAVNGSRQKEQPDVARKSKDQETGKRSGLADEQDGTASAAV